MCSAPDSSSTAGPSRPVGQRVGLFAIPGIALGVGAALIAWRHRFDGLYGQDPFAYYAYAVGPLRESLAHGRPLPPLYWPPGYPLLIIVVASLIGTTPFAGQVVSLLAGAAVPTLTAWLAWEVIGKSQDDIWTPALAGLLAG